MVNSIKFSIFAKKYLVMNKVSIIMPSYNAAKFIAAAIQSVIEQTYSNWELLITDDCSKDDTINIIKKFQEIDNRIQLFSTGKNSGAAVARNISLQNATGKYIAFLDSDDTWISNKLETQIKFMEKKNIAFSFSNYSVMKEDGTLTGNIIHAPKVIGYHGYLRNTIIGCLTVIIDREKTGNFLMPNIKTSEDMALWLDIMKRGYKAWGLQVPLAQYRVVSNSLTSKKWIEAKYVWKVYREIEHINPIYSAICFIGYAINAIIKRL